MDLNLEQKLGFCLAVGQVLLRYDLRCEFLPSQSVDDFVAVCEAARAEQGAALVSCEDFAGQVGFDYELVGHAFEGISVILNYIINCREGRVGKDKELERGNCEKK
jgi:hypothetical protein